MFSKLMVRRLVLFCTLWLMHKDFIEPQNANLPPSFSASSNELSSTETFTTRNSFTPGALDLSPQRSNSSPSQPTADELSTSRDHSKNVSTDAPAILAQKRHRNNIAARKYRQKHIDRISELELALETMTRDRNELRIQLAKREAEVEVLKDIVQRQNSWKNHKRSFNGSNRLADAALLTASVWYLCTLLLGLKNNSVSRLLWKEYDERKRVEVLSGDVDVFYSLNHEEGW